MATFVVAHGAWSAGWAWKKMRPLLRERGHELFTPTYTGLGERAHLANKDIDLDTHIADVLGVLEYEDLRGIVLVGHSYGGMVATGVADRAAPRIAQLVYLDAFVPRDGQSLVDLVSPQARQARAGSVAADGEGWRIPPNPMPPDTSPEDAAWATPRRVMQPAKTFAQPVRLTGAVERLPRSYIYCRRKAGDDPFRQFADRLRNDPGWKYFEMEASHNPHITTPRELAALLERISSSGSVPELRS
jgi:pimeloyl-ACP methyl ester carboxylesterase